MFGRDFFAEPAIPNEILVNIDMTLEVFEYLKQDLKLISDLVTSFSYLSDLSARRHNSMLQENMRNDFQ